MYHPKQWVNACQSTAVWVTGLADGRHRLQVCVTGRRNPAAEGVGIAPRPRGLLRRAGRRAAGSVTGRRSAAVCYTIGCPRSPRTGMNFNTTNNTFRQLMGNGLSYRVPAVSNATTRGVPMSGTTCGQDIVALFEADPEPAHYMGYLVLQSADNREFDIIDGQQRMTTLSLLMLAAVSRLSDLAAPDDPGDPQTRRAEQLRASYIGYL